MPTTTPLPPPAVGGIVGLLEPPSEPPGSRSQAPSTGTVAYIGSGLALLAVMAAASGRLTGGRAFETYHWIKRRLR